MSLLTDFRSGITVDKEQFDSISNLQDHSNPGDHPSTGLIEARHGSNSTAMPNGTELAASPNMVIQQFPFSVILDARGLLAAAVVLLLGMNFLPRLVLEAVILIVPVVLMINNGYQNFLLLGPGGTPQTFMGYLRLSCYGLLAVKDPFTAPLPDRTVEPREGILADLPARSGTRPQVVGLAPQRQMNQIGPRPVSDLLQRLLETAAARDPKTYHTGVSCTEKHGFAFFARHPVTLAERGHGEICHIHDSERSMHMNLHPDDIKEVIEKGWGERHPLAFSGWVKAPCPTTLVMIYAPRGTRQPKATARGEVFPVSSVLICSVDEKELLTICKIVEAASWYRSGKRIELGSLSSH
jgi:hypothetical protein